MKLPLICIIFFSNLFWICCEILTTNLSEVIQDEEVRRLVQDFAGFCEGTFLCEVDVSVPEMGPTENGIRVPCCDPCNCHDDCYLERGGIKVDCCPDVIPHILNQIDVQRIEDFPFRCNQVDYPLIPLTDSFIESYDMISKCPTSYSDTDVREQCEQEYYYTNMSGADITHIIPVSDTRTNIPFKNIHCAVCNEINITDVQYWATDVTCGVILPFLFHNRQYSVQVLHDRPDCSFHYTPPQGSRRCTYLIDRCNVTGLYIAEDPFLERACASYTSVYKNFKNIHCYLCNGYSKDSIADECFLESEWSMVGFAGTFDFGETFRGLQTGNRADRACDLSSIYDKWTNNCRPIFCSEMMRLSGLRCEPYYIQASPISYEIRFRLIPRFELAGLDTALNLTYKISERLTSLMENGRLESCLYFSSIHMNITEDKIHDNAELNKASILQLDIKVSTIQEDLNSKHNVPTDIEALISLYETQYSELGNFTIQYLAEEHHFSYNYPQEQSDRIIKHFPSSSHLFHNQYYVNKAKLVTILSTLPSTGIHVVCHTPIHISYLQNCAKVILANDTFVQDVDENNMAEVKVLGEAVETNEVVFITDTEKLIICAEKYLELVDKKMRRSRSNDGEKPVSKSEKLKVQLHLLQLTFLLKFSLSTQ